MKAKQSFGGVSSHEPVDFQTSLELRPPFALFLL
jgi:hypothetical protein